MEQSEFLIDSNAVIDYLGKKLPDSGMNFMNKIVDLIPNVSIITKIEVLGFNSPLEHYLLLESFIEDADVFDLVRDVVHECINLRKKHRINLPDAIIAATAITYDLTLLTRNIEDFKNIERLKLLNPHKV